VRCRVVLTAAITGVLAAVALTGCSGKPAGVDGDLVNNWAAMPEPKVPVPTAPACYDAIGDPAEIPAATFVAPIPCAGGGPHNVEAIHVGQFTAADAEADTPPLLGSPARRGAYAECTAKAREFLGDDWRVARLLLSVALPSARHWEGGARWFRCDLVEYANLHDTKLAARNASLKGVLAGPSDLRVACAKGTTVSTISIDIKLASCAEPHNLEFAGIRDYPEGTDPAGVDEVKDCRPLVAAFIGVPNDDNLNYRTGLVASSFPREAWDLGNRGVRCFVMPAKDVTGSVKGRGPKGFPIN